MAAWLSPATLRNLADKLYEKRKTAALEVEQARVTRCRANVSVRAQGCVCRVQATKALAAAGDLISVVRTASRARVHVRCADRRLWCAHTHACS